MKTEALRLVEPGKMDVVEIEVPDPGPGEVLVEVKANGICKGDIALFTGELNWGYPFFHGHEPVGIVVKTGPGVNGIQPGDAVACLGSPSYRRHIVTSAPRVAKIPVESPDLPLWVIEPASCAVNGVQSSGLKVGDRVALVGCGYMGMLVLQALPREVLSRLVVADTDPSRLELARSFGATETYNPKETDLAELAKESGCFDVVIEASGVKGTLSVATAMVRTAGILNIFGWHQGEEMVPTHEWHYKGLKVLNTAPMFVDDFTPCFRAAVALMGKGRIDQSKLITHRFELDKVEEGFKIAAGKKDGYIKGVILF